MCILPVVLALMGGHRDTPCLVTHPLRMDYIQATIYRKDVNEDTHCFTISPGSVTEPDLDRDEQLKRGGVQYLYGGAGNVILFNASGARGLGTFLRRLRPALLTRRDP
ncbi:MAG TPA: hypothetical protein EYQ20_01435 [candidate division Zixibacteria bacterium]|nr:hypothetical protein [candidate division Zixibacteria bacterium]